MTDIEPRREAAVIEFAHELDAQIRQLAQHAHVVLEALYALVNEAQATNIHVALGFPSWTAYLADALDGQWHSLLDRDKRAEAIKYLAAQGMSQRAIARVTGASKGAIHRELDGCPNLGQVITGLDGKSYPRPEPPQPGAPDDSPESDGESDEEFVARKWAEHEASGRRRTIPATLEAAVAELNQIYEDQVRMERIRFEMELAQLWATPLSAERHAKEFGLRMRYAGNLARRAIEDGISIEEYAEQAGTSVEMVETYLDAVGFTVTAEDVEL